jgi:CIC family chloride channel protein
MTASLRHTIAGFARRSREVLVLSAVTGVATGLGVAAFEWVTGRGALDHLYELPVGVQVVAPGIGLVAAAMSLRWLAGGASPSTSDEYIRNFHDKAHPLDLRPAAGRVLASVVTLGSGGALGFEGPSIYIGSVIGTGLQARFRRFFLLTDAKVLMVAGAAAGVAAIFKTPATGAIFALEVPYHDDTAKRMLLPALVGSVSGYLVYVAIYGTAPLFPVDGSPPFGLRELAGAALVGVLAGLAARAFAWTVKLAKRWNGRVRPAVRIVLAAIALAVLVMTSRLVYGESLALGSGYNVIAWLGSDTRAWWAVALLLALRTAATSATVGGGGAGGLFVPLVVGGALVGQLCGGGLAEPTQTLFPVIGVAAFLGAGYRTPLAAVMFVAESTGRPGFIVPGLIATVVSQLMMGSSSVSPYQSSDRGGHLERRFDLPLTTAIQGDVLTVPPDTSLDELVTGHLLMTRRTTVPVVELRRYVGLVSIEDLGAVPQAEWPTTTVGAIARADVPPAHPSWTIADAVRSMDASRSDLLPVVADDGAFVGIVTTADLVRLDEILGTADESETG